MNNNTIFGKWHWIKVKLVSKFTAALSMEQQTSLCWHNRMLMMVWQQTLWKKRCLGLSTDQTGYPHWSAAYNTLPKSTVIYVHPSHHCARVSVIYFFYIVMNTHFWSWNIMSFHKSLYTDSHNLYISEFVFKQVIPWDPFCGSHLISLVSNYNLSCPRGHGFLCQRSFELISHPVPFL